jgi:hypothetical protein
MVKNPGKLGGFERVLTSVDKYIDPRVRGQKVANFACFVKIVEVDENLRKLKKVLIFT